MATGAVSAVIVDASRLTVYGTGFLMDYFANAEDIIGTGLMAGIV